MHSIILLSQAYNVIECLRLEWYNMVDKELNKGDEDMLAILDKKAIKVPPMVRIKQLAQEAIQKKGLTEEELYKILDYRRYEKN